MRKLITFLGKYPKQTTYLFDGQTYQGQVFAEALRQFTNFDEMLVFTTEEAKATTWPVLEALRDERIRSIAIPIGANETELWALFATLTEQIAQGDTLIFDITHGLRSIPFLVFLAAAYLKEARDVTIEAIYYGAFELGNEKEDQPAPVIDLSGFVSLLDWLTATNQFIYTGNAGYLASQLQKQEQRSLDKLANTVSEIALGLQLLRPTQVSEAAYQLPECLATVKQVLPPPFALLSDNLISGYGQFGANPDESPHTRLAKQLAIINWYHQTSQIVHTLSLSREWLVSLLCVHFGVDVQDKNEREEMEILLAGGKLKDPETGKTSRVSKYLDRWSTVTEGKRLRKLWSNPPYQLANLRNDVLHSGFRRNPKPAQEIIDLTREIVQELNEIAVQWGVTHHALRITEAP